MRIRAIFCCIYFSLVPWWIYEKKKHYRRTYWRHIKLNFGDAKTWLLRRETQEDIDFEVSWAMFNYYSALGDPTRANGVNGNQWRSFCNSCIGLSNFISTAEMDLIFASAGLFFNIGINDFEIYIFN